MRAARAALAVAAALLAGCLPSFERPPLEQTRFVLRPAAPAQPAAKTAGTLAVDRVRVAPLFDHQGFVYRTGEDTFATDPRFQWFGPPGVVLRAAVADWLEAASPFPTLERGAVSGAGWLLETEVDRLYADLRDPDAPFVILSGRFRLLDLRAREVHRPLSQRFDEREPAGGGTPQELVDAWSRALARALAALEPELAAVAGAAARAGR